MNCINFRYLLIVIALSVISLYSFSQQDELDSLLNLNIKDQPVPVIATFKSTRIITGHSIERMQQNDLDFRISHRFGKLNTGSYELFGLDYSSSYFSLEYGIFDWLMAGAGRATYEKTFNGFIKASILRQSTGKKSFPVSVSYLTGIYVNSLKYSDTSRTNYFSSRLSYIHQLLIAKKINRKISLQLSPVLIHRNMVKYSSMNNDIYSLGIGGRYKLTNRTSLNFEYFLINNVKDVGVSENNTFPLSIGFDIETGSHVFQLMLTNAPTMTENAFLGTTNGSWKNGDIHFGFNITRVFTLNKKEKEYEAISD
ncbi:MAG: DUF5777 family beta-barrel protein [Bacteroidota bacterium]